MVHSPRPLPQHEQPAACSQLRLQPPQEALVRCGCGCHFRLPQLRTQPLHQAAVRDDWHRHPHCVSVTVPSGHTQPSRPWCIMLLPCQSRQLALSLHPAQPLPQRQLVYLERQPLDVALVHAKSGPCRPHGLLACRDSDRQALSCQVLLRSGVGGTMAGNAVCAEQGLNPQELQQGCHAN